MLPVEVTGITIAPNPSCVGDTVTFTATFTPAGHTVDSLTWELTYTESIGYGGGIYGGGSTTEFVEATGTTNPWSYAPKHTTKDLVAGGASITRTYTIKATAVSGGHTSTVTANVEVTALEVTGIAPISVNGGGYNEGEEFRYTALVGPAQCAGSASGSANSYTWTRRRTSDWGSGSTAWFAFGGNDKEATYPEEVDPGVWEVKVQLNSGGHSSTATTSVTIQHARVVGFTIVAIFAAPMEYGEPGALITHFKWESTTGRIKDLDDAYIREWLLYKKFVPGSAFAG